jgi:hypothetical protein
MAVMEKRNPWLPAQQKTGLRWVGDKKPMQHTDPELLKFLLQHFPEAHFLHIVRHPFEVVASSDRFNRTPDGDFWLDLSPEEKVERWAFHEQQVLQLRQNLPGRVHSLRYENFCRRTEKELSDVFEFLQLDPDPQALREAARQTRPLARVIAAMRCSAEAARIAAVHGYDLRHPAGRLWVWAQNIYWQLQSELRKIENDECFRSHDVFSTCDSNNTNSFKPPLRSTNLPHGSNTDNRTILPGNAAQVFCVCSAGPRSWRRYCKKSPRAYSQLGWLGRELDEPAAVQRQREVERLGVAQFPQAKPVIGAAPAPVPGLNVMPLAVGHLDQRHTHSVRGLVGLNPKTALGLRAG